MANSKPDKSLFQILGAVVMIGLIVIIVLQNSVAQEVKIYFWSFSLPLFVLLFLSFVFGILLMIILFYPKYRRASRAANKVERLEYEISQLEKQISSNQAPKIHE